ncbi:MAG: bacteriophage holin [Candidatus Omnitrophica bacterium]|nr:bacteriophage holin [Candidatus Omnitrophota bacterium]
MKFNAKALGFSVGVIWGVAIALVTVIYLFSAKTYGQNFLYALSSIYPGFLPTPAGAFLGLCYGFVDGFIGGWLVAKMYNFFAKEN